MITFRIEHNHHRLRRMQVQVCENRLERSLGLLLRQRPAADCAWLLPGSRVAHTIGLLHAIDVLFCDEAGRILRIERALRPCRIAREPCARQVWQLRAGAADRWGWRVGDRISPC